MPETKKQSTESSNGKSDGIKKSEKDVGFSETRRITESQIVNTVPAPEPPGKKEKIGLILQQHSIVT